MVQSPPRPRPGAVSVAVLLATCLLALPCAAQFNADRALLSAAAAGEDGTPSADEWQAFVDGLPREDDGSLRVPVLLAHVLTELLASGGGLTGQDVDGFLGDLDTNGDGVVDAAELAALLQTPADAAGRNASPVAGLVALGADTDGDGRVDPDEWRAAREAGGSAGASVPIEVLAEWFERAMTNSDEDLNAFGPKTLALTLQAELDADRDGRVTARDLERLFSALAAGTTDAPPRDAGFDPSAFAVSEADLARPPGMPWQRSLDDALALVRTTGKPLLICVNTDGETASEALAARRYRDPDFIALAAGFIPVLASPDRHSPRDHDDRGRRVPDPKFGRLVDAEHIDIEPLVYERYFRENRVAPRHVGVSPDGEILFDLYLLNDLSVIDRTLEEHGEFEASLPDPASMTPEELLASPDAGAREHLEAAFLLGDRELRTRLAAVALDGGRDTQHPELLRLALRDEDPAVRQAALGALQRHPTGAPLALYDEAMLAAAATDDPAAAGLALSRGLEAVAAVSTGDDRVRARRLSRLLAAAATDSSTLDVDLWRWSLTGAVPVQALPAPPLTHKDWYTAMGRLEERLETSDDPLLLVLWAQTVLRAAEDFIATGSNVAGMVVTDAHYAARRATKAAPDNADAWAVLAVASQLQGQSDDAVAAAERALPDLVLQARSAMAARVLEVLAQARLAALYDALGSDEGWPAAWVADVIAVYDVLADHPHTSEAQFLAGLDALITLELEDPLTRLLAAAVRRYPTSATVHSYLRWQRLRDEGAAGLQRTYDELAGASRDPTLLWFAGFAFLTAAERHVEEGRDGDALAAYARSIEFFQTAVELQPDFGNALHYVAMAHAGRARIQSAEGDLDLAALSIQDAARASPTSFGEADASGITPAATARELRRALRDAGDDERAAALSAALAEQGVEL